MPLSERIAPELIFPALGGSDRPSVLRTLAEAMAAHGTVADGDALYLRLDERESLGSTAIGDGVAIPHCKMAALDEVAVAIGITAKPIAFGAPDGKPVRLFFLVVSPEDQPAAHLQCLASISRWVKTASHIEQVLELDDAAAIYRLLRAESPA